MINVSIEFVVGVTSRLRSDDTPPQTDASRDRLSPSPAILPNSNLLRDVFLPEVVAKLDRDRRKTKADEWQNMLEASTD